MILYISTIEDHNIIVAIKEGDKIIARKKINAPFKQTERLLPLISALLKKAGIRLNQIKKIEVANKGGSFTALRIGVITANALGFALGVPVMEADGMNEKLSKLGFSVIKPIYDKEPNITLKKQESHIT